VAVGEHEGAVAKQRRHMLEPPAGERLEPGLHEVDAPVLDRSRVARDLLVIPQIEREAALELRLLEEPALEHVAAIAEREHELAHAVMRVVLHDVPQDRPAADLDQRLRSSLRLLGEPAAEAAGEDDDLHASSRNVCSTKSSCLVNENLSRAVR